ncbi:hypothetical protein PQX77_014939 [Marasmius sp. AFHP31]|nr:hypothetical protein PQX77_014939 [Marasmius sp. AFHP31]
MLIPPYKRMFHQQEPSHKILQVVGESSNSVSLLDAMGEEGVQPAVKDVAVDSEGEDIPMQPLAAGGPEQSNAESGSEVKKMGGPGADEKV